MSASDFNNWFNKTFEKVKVHDDELDEGHGTWLKSNNDMIEEVLDKYKKNYFLQVVLFFTGVFIHLLLEYVGLDKWYCEKKCIADKCKLVCEKPIN